MLAVKMHLLYKKAQARTAQREQQSYGRSSVAEDLRATFLDAREVKTEENQLKARLAELRAERAREAEEVEPLLDEAHADEVLGGAEREAAFRVPHGFSLAVAPTPEQLDPANEASHQLIGMCIGYNWPGIGWVLGKITATNRDRRYRACGNVMNFIIAFDQDDGTARCHLTTEAYGESSAEDAWVLFTTDI